MKTRVTELLGIRLPIVQAGMSWASSNAALPLAVSKAGGLGVIAAGPMVPDALRAAICDVRAGTDAPFAVNVPLYNRNSATFLDIVEEERVPIIIASQGGPRAHVKRFRALGVKWLHVVAAPAHALKAEEAGVDALVVVGAEAGGHPPPDEVGTLVVVRAVARAVKLPIIAGGGVADGYGMAALMALGADAVQLGTRFLVTHEAGVHDSYKAAVRAAGLADTALVGRAGMPIRMLKNSFAAAYEAAYQSGQHADELNALFATRSLKDAALDGDVEWGKTEAGQSAGLIDDILPAAQVVENLMREFDAARVRLAGFGK
jgi:enoyl-[acyl-carrier protein] reductase II